MSKALSIAKLTLDEYEAEMDQCRDNIRGDFRRFGELLDKVLTEERYLERDPTLTKDTYCRQRWGFSLQRAHQIIQASKAKAVEISSTVVDEFSTIQNEWQARNLLHPPRHEPREFLNNPATWSRPYKYTPESELTPEQIEIRNERNRTIWDAREHPAQQQERTLETYRAEAREAGLTPQQEAAADFGVGWSKAMHKLWVFYNSLRDHGGVAKLARKWSKEVKQNTLTELCAVRDCINECIEYFEKELGK